MIIIIINNNDNDVKKKLQKGMENRRKKTPVNLHY